MPTFDKQLLERICHNDPSLTTLDLRKNQIGDAGAKDLSLALKDNHTLTRLHLGDNQIGAAGAKDLSLALKNNTTLTTLDLGDNQIDDTCRQEIHSFIQQNTQALLKRRQEFIYKIILLARDAKNLHSDSLWRRLPHDIRLYMFSFLNFRGETTIGKTTKQIVHCAQFIVAKGDECNGLIKAKQKIQLIEKVDSKGNYGFQFFKPLKKNPEVSQKQDSRVKHCVLS